MTWLSAYEGKNCWDWETEWKKESTLVLEGWEQWIKAALKADMDHCRLQIRHLFQELKQAEKVTQHSIVLIMLEMGRGIVPMCKEERALRDMCGWALQDASAEADQVVYVWHGLSRVLK